MTSKSNQMISGDQETAGVGKDFGKNGENLRYFFFEIMCFLLLFLPGPGVSGVRSMGPGVCLSLQELFETLLMMIPIQY